MAISEMTANQFRNEGHAFADDERGNVHYGRIGNEAERKSYT